MAERVEVTRGSYVGEQGEVSAEGKQVKLDKDHMNHWFKDDQLKTAGPAPDPPPVPAEPMARVTADKLTAGQNELVHFDASLSTGVAPLAYQLSLDEYTFIPSQTTWQSSPLFSFAFKNLGDKSVLVRIKDANGKVSTSSPIIVSVVAAVPVPDPQPDPDPIPDPPPPPPGAVIVMKTKRPSLQEIFRLIGENVEDIQKKRIGIRVVPMRTGRAQVAPLLKWDGFGRCAKYGSTCYAWGQAALARLALAYYKCDPATGAPAGSPYGQTDRPFTEAIADWKNLNPNGSPVIGFVRSGKYIDVVAGEPIWLIYTPNANVEQHGFSFDFVRTSREAAGPHADNTWPGDYLGRSGLLACEVALFDNEYGADRGSGMAEIALPEAIICYEDGVIENVNCVYGYHGSGRSRTVTVPAGATRLVAVGACSRTTGGGGQLTWTVNGRTGKVNHDGGYDERDVDGKGIYDDKALYPTISGVPVTPGQATKIDAPFDCVQEADDSSLTGFLTDPSVQTGAGLWPVFV